MSYLAPTSMDMCVQSEESAQLHVEIRGDARSIGMLYMHLQDIMNGSVQMNYAEEVKTPDVDRTVVLLGDG